MIRNMVFDMGRVLLDYDPVGVCRHYTEDESAIGIIRRELFESEEWRLLDLGAIGEEEALKRVFRRLPEESLKILARKSLEHWHEFNLTPKPGMGELVRELKERGLGIYLCSNASLRLRVFEWMIPGIECFDGTLVSAEERLVKPDPAIYQRLFEKFSLKPEECFFIDDLSANIAGAERCGMEGYCFFDGDVGRLRKILRERGIL
ncbi:MAG: HAD family hydrolase [Clostridium sp.]